MIVNFCNVSKTKTAILSFIMSELFILIIELTFGVPLNVYYHLDLNIIKTTDTIFPLLLSNSEQAEPTGGIILFMANSLSLLLWSLTSPALLIAIVVYILAPDEESGRL